MLAFSFPGRQYQTRRNAGPRANMESKCSLSEGQGFERGAVVKRGRVVSTKVSEVQTDTPRTLCR